MSDNFFGFNTEFPSGRGVLGRPGAEDEFLSDEVEEEYDALNDETFGHAANDDWEEAHEKLSELIKNNNIDLKSYFNDSLLENDDSPEEIVSKSISQLGLEDDLDDPAIMTISRNYQPSVPLRTAFSSSPPPPAILESEVCGSPKTYSIWSTTPKDSGVSFLKSFGPSSSSTPHPESHNVSLHSVSDSVFISPQKAWRAEELERDLLNSSKPEKPPVSSSNWQKPHVNQNMTNKVFQGPRPPNLNQNHNLNQRIFTREEIERQMLAESRMPYTKGGNFAQLMPSGLAHPNMPPMRSANLNPPVPTSIIPLRRRGPHMGSEHPFVPFPSNVHPRSMLNHPPPPRPDFLMPNHPLSGVLNPFVGVPLRPINHPLLPNWKPLVMLNKQLEEGFKNGVVQSDHDEYAGLMTQKEKDWLIKIQMMLLKCENPYVEDYYYTTMVTRKCKKKYSESANKGTDAPELILPESSKPEKTSYVPTQFEGSLGKLQAVSVNFPRKVLDIKVTRTLEDEEGRVVTNQSLQRFRRLLLSIEKLYSYVLGIEDEERRILALPDTDEAPHRENIASLTQKIFDGLCVENSPEENFQNIMLIRKGRNLLLRSLPLFNKEQQLQCLTHLCKCLSTVLRKDSTDMVFAKSYSKVTAAIQRFSLPDLVQLIAALEREGSSEISKEKNNIVSALKNKFGSTVIYSMIGRAEDIYSGTDLLETDIHAKWSKSVLRLVDFLCSLDGSALSPPLTPPSQLLVHFKRFPVEQSELGTLEEKLKLLDTKQSEV